jgi:hypothetical protein
MIAREKIRLQYFVIIMQIVHDTGFWSARNSCLDLGPRHLCRWLFLITETCVCQQSQHVITFLGCYKPCGVKKYRIYFSAYSCLHQNTQQTPPPFFLKIFQKGGQKICDNLPPPPNIFMVLCEHMKCR